MSLHPLFFPLSCSPPSKATMGLPTNTEKWYTQKPEDEKPADGGVQNWKGKEGLEKATGICRIHTNINFPSCFSDNYYCSRRHTNILFLCLKAKLCIIHVNKNLSMDCDITSNKPSSILEHKLNYRYKNIALALIWMADSAHSYVFLIALIQLLK